ncbi:MAG: DUF4239 domain-containing protein [Vicinamibacteria bacterium]
MNAADLIGPQSGPYFAGALFAGMLLLLEMGRRIGRKHRERDPEGLSTGAIDGAVFALLGLLVAFTFSGATSRFDGRRQLVTEEANAIGTAYLRIDLLPESAQPPLRDLFRRYLDSRLETYRKLPDVQAAMKEWETSVELQRHVWANAVTACRESGSSQATMLLIPALNAMIDISTTRLMSTRVHPPSIVYIMLGAVSFLAALLAGYGMAFSRRRSWFHLVAFAAVIAATVFVILDLEYPRLGLVRVDAADQVLSDLRRSMD